MKRLLDIFGAIAGIFLLSPILLVVALLILAKMGRPVLFRQTRAGLDGSIFMVLKFRTMKSREPGTLKTEDDADLITPLGDILRAWSLDELPDLWNVLKGKMSLVGPRPLMAEYLPLYSQQQARRHNVRPGITGWAQVNGRNAISWEEKFELDVWYVDNMSLLLDLKIIGKTIQKVIMRDGMSADGHVTMPLFTGSDQPIDRSAGRQ